MVCHLVKFPDILLLAKFLDILLLDLQDSGVEKYVSDERFEETKIIPDRMVEEW